MARSQSDRDLHRSNPSRHQPTKNSARLTRYSTAPIPALIGLRILKSLRSLSVPSKAAQRNSMLRPARLCRNGKPCPPASDTQSRIAQDYEVTQGSHCPPSESEPSPGRQAFLARRVVRSLGTKRSRVRADQAIHRAKPSHGRLG